VLSDIQYCFKTNRILYSKHAREEMIIEEFGKINEEEVYQAVMNGEIIESYEHSKPYPSVLLFGRTNIGRPIHIVSAYSKDDNLTIIVTVYQPDPNRWINYRRRI
jgi:hypothetical protein